MKLCMVNCFQMLLEYFEQCYFSQADFFPNSAMPRIMLEVGRTYNVNYSVSLLLEDYSLQYIYNVLSHFALNVLSNWAIFIRELSRT